MRSHLADLNYCGRIIEFVFLLSFLYLFFVSIPEAFKASSIVAWKNCLGSRHLFAIVEKIVSIRDKFVRIVSVRDKFVRIDCSQAKLRSAGHTRGNVA